ncbi:MAG: DUF3857 domain-containing protein, partial [Bdellovibrionota bacterium]
MDQNGRSTLRRKLLIRVNNDRGRESQSVQTLTFNSRAQEFKLVSAATLNGSGKELVRTKVDSANIEIKEIGELSQAFDSIKQVALSYSQVQIGSRIELEYEILNTELAIENFWSTAVSFSQDYIEDFELTVDSKKPLHFKTNDPAKKLIVKYEAKSGGFRFDAKSTSP